VESNYRVLGVIPRQDMMVLLAHSGGVLNPSRFEGWSTTVEEAKALGKALMLSDIAVHREQVAGRRDAQLYGTEEPAVLADMLAAWDLQHSAGEVTAHPPRPDPSLYVTFEQQYITLLRRLAGAELRVA
jgi:glycosyltransferase involved in cell wall biosynthesis